MAATATQAPEEGGKSSVSLTSALPAQSVKPQISVFLKLIEAPGPYFSLKLTYRGDELTSAALDGRPLALDEGGLPS